MMFEVKMTGKSYKMLKSIVRETGRKPHKILEDLLCGDPESDINEFYQEPDEKDPVPSEPGTDIIELNPGTDITVETEPVEVTEEIVNTGSGPIRRTTGKK